MVILANYINAAIAQSGRTTNPFIFEQLQNSNNNWHTLCTKLSSCTPSSNFQNTFAEAQAYLDAMKTANARDLMNAYVPVVGPVPTDGIFFTSGRELKNWSICQAQIFDRFSF